MEWIRSFWKQNDFTCTGSLVKFVDPSDNYRKLTILMNSTLSLPSSTLLITNDDYDPDQDQLQEYRFPIKDEMFFTHFTYTDEDAIVSGVKWRNLKDSGETEGYFGFEFENLEDSEFFLRVIGGRVEVEEEGYQHPAHQLKAEPMQLKNLAASNQSAPSNINKVSLKPKELSKNEEEKVQRDAEFKKSALDSLKTIYSPDQIMFMSAANLFLIEETAKLVETGVGFLLAKHPNFTYTIDIVSGTEILLRSVITSDFNFDVSVTDRKFTWVERSQDSVRCWEATLTDEVSTLSELCKIAQYETHNKLSVEQTFTEEDRRWLMAQEEPSQPADNQMDLEWSDTFTNEETSNIYDSIQSLINPLAIVSTDENFRFYQLDDSALVLAGEYPMRSGLAPHHLMLHQQDNRMLMLDPNNRSSVLCMDVSRGDIVEEWTADGVTKFNAIAPVNKFAPCTPEQTFLAVSDKSLFRIDPRVPQQDKAVTKKSYSKNPGFSCIVSTAEGHIATGNKLGEIKLYNEIGKNAKTNLPGLGHPIKSIDVTKDGEWVLATCEGYLIVVPVSVEGIKGFIKPLGKAKRKPVKLVLKPQDIAKYGLSQVNFTPARFNFDESNNESAIITSTGNLIVIWNFLTVKKGNYTNYIVKVMNEQIVKNEFRFNQEDVMITHNKKMQFQRNRVRFHDV